MSSILSDAAPAPSGLVHARDRQSLWSLFSEAPNSETFFHAWLALQCAQVAHTTRGLLVLGEPDAGPFLPASIWPAGEGASVLLTAHAEQVLASRQPIAMKGAASSVVGYPVQVQGHLHGLVAIEIHSLADAALADAMRSLQWGLGGLIARLQLVQVSSDEQLQERLVTTLDVLASTLGQDTAASAAQALVTDLATRLECDRVSFGFQRRGFSHVVAVSHSAQFGKRIDLIRSIALAMDEALDQKSVVVFPPPAAESLVVRDHAALARGHGCDHALTVPFEIGPDASGAFTFERAGPRPFDAGTIELCQAVVALCSRVLQAKRLNDRLLVARIHDAARDQLARLLGPTHFARKLFVAGIVLAVAFFSFATMRYTVGNAAFLEGSVRRVLVAPFDGYVASAPHRAGDVVREGEVLATLDDRDLKLDYLKWSSQQAQYSKQYQEAVGQRDRAQANVSLAQVQQAQAQMDLLAEQLMRAGVAAPFAGIVTSGDLSQALGSAVKRGQTLFEVAPLNAYRVILEIDEGEIAAFQVGQKGELVLTALPNEVFPLTMVQLTPVTSTREGRNYFRAEATLDRISDQLRPGMEGVGKVDVGERKVIWIWTHRMMDWLRLTLWSWMR